MREQSPALSEALGRLVQGAVSLKMTGQGSPLVVALFTTNRCPCSCASCLWKHNDWKDTSLDVLKRFYSEAKAEGLQATAMTGGEPFLRKDLGELCSYVGGELKMPILLFTTGYYLLDRMDEVLPHISMLMLSLDSPYREKHDAIRGLPGLYDRLMESVKQVKERYPDLSLQFNCCVQRGVEEEIDDLLALCERMDMLISFDVITEHRNGGADSHFSETDMGLPLADLQRIAARLLALKQNGAPILNSESYFRYFVEGRKGYRCHLPKMVMWVDGRGLVEDCLQLSRPIANIADMSVKEILALPRFAQLRTDAEACSSCSSPTMVDFSQVWEDPSILFAEGGLSFG